MTQHQYVMMTTSWDDLLSHAVFDIFPKKTKYGSWKWKWVARHHLRKTDLPHFNKWHPSPNTGSSQMLMEKSGKRLPMSCFCQIACSSTSSFSCPAITISSSFLSSYSQEAVSSLFVFILFSYHFSLLRNPFLLAPSVFLASAIVSFSCFVC